MGANRGASGIDGVLSTAAGFAAGMGRPCSLLIGDLSFLHDINGLNMLRGGEARPPLTVVLINNAGGGIFSFLPIAGRCTASLGQRRAVAHAPARLPARLWRACKPEPPWPPSIPLSLLT